MNPLYPDDECKVCYAAPAEAACERCGAPVCQDCTVGYWCFACDQQVAEAERVWPGEHDGPRWGKQ